MNNKKLGTEWEQEVCKYLASNGYWVHFIVPNASGSQPFDIIAVKDGEAFAIDAKTCVANSFSISRLEENQILSFEKWIRCGNNHPMIAVKHNHRLFWIEYEELKAKRNIKLNDDNIDEFYTEE